MNLLSTRVDGWGACVKILKKASAIFSRQWVAKPSTNRRQFLLLARACRDAAFAKRRNIDQRFACENFMADMRRACRNPQHARLIGVTQAAACKRVREGLSSRGSSKQADSERVRDWLLKDLMAKACHLPGQTCPSGQRCVGGRCVPKDQKDDISVDDLLQDGGLVNPDQGKPCPSGQTREPVTGRCVPKRRPRS